MGLKYKKDKNFSEWYSEVIQKAELADLGYNVKGFLVHRWWVVDIMKRMFAAYRKELEKKGHKEAWFPAVIPESNLKKEAQHAEGFRAEVFWVDKAGSSKKKLDESLVLRPTSETAMYTMYAKWIRSWRDLPFKRYQGCNIWRYESTTRPFLRGREFWWIEAHNVFATRKDAEKQMLEDMNITETVMHRQFGIPFIVVRRPFWDTFPGAEYTHAADTLNPDGKSLQQPDTHMLGQNFSRAMDIKFKDKNEKDQYGWQTCHGPCIWRMIGSLISIHGDDKGLVLPFNLAPHQVVIIPIYKKGKNKQIAAYCKKVTSKLEKAGYRVFFDADEEESPGSKFYNWEMKGVPLRIEIGPRDIKARQVVAVQRHDGKKSKVRVASLGSYVKKLDGSVLKWLIKRADAFLKAHIFEAKTYKELEKKIKKGGFVRVNWCSIDEDGEPCAERIEKDLLARVRGIRVDKKEVAKGKCVVCKAPARHVVYIARQY